MDLFCNNRSYCYIFRTNVLRALAIHFKEFIAELQKLGSDERYVEQRKSALSRLYAECGWKSLGKISPDQFLKWRRQHTAGAKTLNEYLSGANTFINWLTDKLHFSLPATHHESSSAENGVVPTVAQHLMRHSTVTLTTKTYISSASLPLAEAIRRVPAIVFRNQNRHTYRHTRHTYRHTKTSRTLSFGVAG